MSDITPFSGLDNEKYQTLRDEIQTMIFFQALIKQDMKEFVSTSTSPLLKNTEGGAI